LFDLDEGTYSHVLKVAKIVVAVLDKVFEPVRTCMVVEGFEVPHSHIKLYPVYEEVLEMQNQKEISAEETEEIAATIRPLL
jgi:histidine triad (HIT) family protein